MAEKKEKTSLTVGRNDSILNENGTDIIRPQYYLWEFKTTLDKLGNKGKQRLIDFMESIGFFCEDMPDECKRHFFRKKGVERLDELSYSLAVGACLCLGYDCVTKDREVIALYKGETK